MTHRRRPLKHDGIGPLLAGDRLWFGSDLLRVLHDRVSVFSLSDLPLSFGLFLSHRVSLSRSLLSISQVSLPFPTGLIPLQFYLLLLGSPTLSSLCSGEKKTEERRKNKRRKRKVGKEEGCGSRFYIIIFIFVSRENFFIRYFYYFNINLLWGWRSKFVSILFVKIFC
jgi:hypothetical protein